MLRRDALVGEALQRWWTVMQNTFGTPYLEQAHFVTVLRKVAKALLEPDEYDVDDVVAAAHDDWQTDSCGLDQMSREMFMDSLFELCDIVSTTRWGACERRPPPFPACPPPRDRDVPSLVPPRRPNLSKAAILLVGWPLCAPRRMRRAWRGAHPCLVRLTAACMYPW